MAAWENGPEQQLEYGKDVFYYAPSSTFFSNASCLIRWKTLMKRLSLDNVTNLRFSDDIDALAAAEQEPEALV